MTSSQRSPPSTPSNTLMSSASITDDGTTSRKTPEALAVVRMRTRLRRGEYRVRTLRKEVNVRRGRRWI